MKPYRFFVVVEKDDEEFFAWCPELQGCSTQGVTDEEAVEALRDVIRLRVEDRPANHESIPQVESISLSSLEVAV